MSMLRFGELWGASEAMQDVFALLERVASADLAVLLLGETGTGKELAARALHFESQRRAAQFVVVDCGAIQPNLIESELFGHEKSAFTGAERQRKGAFELADHGTVLLDEIGDLPLALQPKLLRVLERRQVQRLGASMPISVDVRLVAATHRNLSQMVRAGTFREDLYFRLAEMEIELPPLRDRPDDVALLAEAMLAEIGPITLAPEALSALDGRPWPGNVRQLRNVLRRAAVMAEGGVITVTDLEAPRSTQPDAPAGTVDASLTLKQARDAWSAPLERTYVEALLRRFSGDMGAAAQHAGVHRKSFERLVRRHDLRAIDFR